MIGKHDTPPLQLMALPAGSVWSNSGRLWWRVRFPDDDKFSNVPLRPAAQSQALPDSAPKAQIEAVAWRIWEVERLKRTKLDERPKMAFVSLEEAAARYLADAVQFYGSSRESRNHALLLRPLRESLGDRDVETIVVADLLEVRNRLADKWARKTINHAVSCWRLFATWMMEHRLCSAAAKIEMCAATPLKRGRSKASESVPVRAAPHWAVKTAMRDAPPSLRAMVYVQELTGMRPGEVCSMRNEDIDRHGRLWLYRPQDHKNAWRGKPRVVVLGPRAQKALRPYLKERGPVFSPALADREWRAQKRNDRASPVQPSQRRGMRRVERPEKKPGAEWVREAYTSAVAKRVTRAVRDGRLPKEEAWSPNQLRHACATRVRLWFGLDAAKGVLGHSMHGGVTDIYSFEAMEREAIRLASPAMQRIG